MNVDERAVIATTNFHEQSQTFIQDSDLETGLNFHGFADLLLNDMFLYALRIYSNEKHRTRNNY